MDFHYRLLFRPGEGGRANRNETTEKEKDRFDDDKNEGDEREAQTGQSLMRDRQSMTLNNETNNDSKDGGTKRCSYASS